MADLMSQRAPARARHYMSKQHLMSAIHFCELAHERERKPSQFTRGADDVIRRRWIEHRAYVSAAVMCSVASLEANVNEVFSDAAEANLTDYPQLAREQRTGLKRCWEDPAARTPFLRIKEKYKAALKAAETDPIDFGREPGQSASLLISLRNALTHYSPEWLEVPQAEDRVEPLHRFEKTLLNRFEPNTFLLLGSTPYPDRILGYGCARWAVDTSGKFALEFLKRLHMSAKFGGAIDRVNELPTAV